MKRDRRLSRCLRWPPLGLLLALAATGVTDDGRGVCSPLLHAEEYSQSKPNHIKREIQVDSRELSLESAERYLSLVDRFRRGEQKALEELMDRPSKDIAISIFSIPRAEEYESCLPAAVVLHVECALQLFERDDDDRGFWQLTFARTVIDMMEPTKKRRWLRECLLLVGYYFQRPGVQPLDGRSMNFFKEALSLFPGDPEILLAIGSMYEAVGQIEEDKGKTEKALEYYQRCLEADSRWVEARLRLGATLLKLGRFTEASAELRWVLRNTDDANLSYIAYLLLGDSHKSQGMWREAVRDYEAAVNTSPEWQVACISLSHALQRTGDRSRAAEVVEKCLQLPVDDLYYEDGWWRYHFGLSYRKEDMLEEWRRTVIP